MTIHEFVCGVVCGWFIELPIWASFSSNVLIARVAASSSPPRIRTHRQQFIDIVLEVNIKILAKMQISVELPVHSRMILLTFAVLVATACAQYEVNEHGKLIFAQVVSFQCRILRFLW